MMFFYEVNFTLPSAWKCASLERGSPSLIHQHKSSAWGRARHIAYIFNSPYNGIDTLFLCFALFDGIVAFRHWFSFTEIIWDFSFCPLICLLACYVHIHTRTWSDDFTWVMWSVAMDLNWMEELELCGMPRLLPEVTCFVQRSGLAHGKPWAGF